MIMNVCRTMLSAAIVQSEKKMFKLWLGVRCEARFLLGLTVATESSLLVIFPLTFRLYCAGELASCGTHLSQELNKLNFRKFGGVFLFCKGLLLPNLLLLCPAHIRDISPGVDRVGLVQHTVKASQKRTPYHFVTNCQIVKTAYGE